MFDMSVNSVYSSVDVIEVLENSIVNVHLVSNSRRSFWKLFTAWGNIVQFMKWSYYRPICYSI